MTTGSQSFILKDMNDPQFMIQSLGERNKVDRLAAFFEAYPLQVRVSTEQHENWPATSALHLLPGDKGEVESVVLSVRGRVAEPRALMTAEVCFGGAGNPLLNTLPDSLAVPICDARPALRDTVRAFLAEAEAARCGHRHALDRLGEVIALMALRAAIEGGAARPCLLAGLAHPQLAPVLVAIHEAPAHHWSIEEMAQIAGMSRSRFMAVFPEVVGTTPMAYLTRWRLQLGQRELRKGGAKVKMVARRSGFASAEAFSRAYTKEYGRAPAEDARG
ncbi:helix-turn-helix transcriptional regulator [Variovorax paradoxus]|nr:helix-turn-helix transcriptional regulator [Variovorax paradoxus]